MAPIPLPDSPLHDDAVALRPWRGSDAGAIVTAFADPELHRFSWPSQQPYTHRDARRYLADQARARRDGTALELAIAAAGAGADDDAAIGGCALYDVEIDQARARIGYWLAPQVRGRGLATRAVLLLTEWGLGALALARIELTCAPENAASRAVAARAGYAEEGILRSHMAFKGGRRDTVVHARTSADQSGAHTAPADV